MFCFASCRLTQHIDNYRQYQGQSGNSLGERPLEGQSIISSSPRNVKRDHTHVLAHRLNERPQF